jgi:hypothetical protein
LAALVPTEAASEARSAKEAREVIQRLLAREQVQNQLKLHGIDPAEASARVESLSDAEAIDVANRVDHLPAGGDAVAIIVGAILIVFLVLLLTDLLGLTHVFPFVKSTYRKPSPDKKRQGLVGGSAFFLTPFGAEFYSTATFFCGCNLFMKRHHWITSSAILAENTYIMVFCQVITSIGFSSIFLSAASRETSGAVSHPSARTY